jgi:hypothetical protein
LEERDWRKDWDMCVRATPGPWKWDWSGVCAPSYGSLFGFGRERWKVIDLSCDDCGGRKVEREADRVFIAEAREALPYWLRRVRELEERLKTLEERRCEMCRWWEMDGRSPGNWGHCRRVECCKELDWVRLDSTCRFAVWDRWGWLCGFVTRADFGCLCWERGGEPVRVEPREARE